MNNNDKKPLPFDPLWILSLLAVLLIAYLQYRHWGGSHGENMHVLVDAYEGVLNGTPHWRAYQNRLLSPALVHALGWVSSEPYALFVQIWMVVLDLGLFFMLHHLTRDVLKSLLAVLAGALLWTLETHYWSYPWDFTEAGFLLALAWLAVEGKSLRWLLGLFVIALLNRESAVYLAVYMVATGAATKVYGQGTGKQMMVWGVALAVVGLAWTEALRNLLFDYSSLAGVQADLQHVGFGNHFHLGRNIQIAKQLLREAPPLLFILLGYGCALLIVLVRGIERRHAPLTGMAVALLAYLLSLPVFGLLHEGRIYQPFNWCLPFMVLFAFGAKPVSGERAE
jgi:hypothetical protein